MQDSVAICLLIAGNLITIPLAGIVSAKILNK